MLLLNHITRTRNQFMLEIYNRLTSFLQNYTTCLPIFSSHPESTKRGITRDMTQHCV